MTSVISQAPSSKVRALVERVVLSSSLYSGVIVGSHEDPTYSTNFSCDGREKIKEQYLCLQQLEAFEDETGANPDDNFDGLIYFTFDEKAGATQLKLHAGVTLEALTKGVRFMSGSVRIDLDILAEAVEQEHDIELPTGWFKEQPYFVDADGALVFGNRELGITMEDAFPSDEV